MPYAKVEDLPDAVKKLPEKKQRQWMHVFNGALKKCKEDGGADADCEESAIKQAWSVVNKEEKSLRDRMREERTCATEITMREFRLQDAPPQNTLAGYAAKFNSTSELLYGVFRESVRPGAFSKTIREADVRALWNHNADYVLGRTKAGTLRLSEDAVGLLVDCTMPDTQWARDLAVSMRRGDVNQMSFGFRAVKDSWNEAGNERELLEVRLLDVSVVTFPAYQDTVASVRDIVEAYGLSFDAITGLFLKASRGAAFTEADASMVEASIATLRRVVPQHARQATVEPHEHSSAAAAEPRMHSVLARLREIETRLKCGGLL